MPHPTQEREWTPVTVNTIASIAGKDDSIQPPETWKELDEIILGLGKERYNKLLHAFETIRQSHSSKLEVEDVKDSLRKETGEIIRGKVAIGHPEVDSIDYLPLRMLARKEEMLQMDIVRFEDGGLSVRLGGQRDKRSKLFKRPGLAGGLNPNGSLIYLAEPSEPPTLQTLLDWTNQAHQLIDFAIESTKHIYGRFPPSTTFLIPC